MILRAMPPDMAEKVFRGSNNPDIGDNADHNRWCSLQNNNTEPDYIAEFTFFFLRKVYSCRNAEGDGYDTGEDNKHNSAHDSTSDTAACFSDRTGEIEKKVPVDDSDTILRNVIENQKERER